MAREMTEWPSKRGPITKIMSSDGCKGDTVPLAVGRWYDIHEFGCHLGNIGLCYHRQQPGGAVWGIPVWMKVNSYKPSARRAIAG